MASPYNVTIKRHNGSTWDTIYPKTTAENIISGTLADARIPGLNASKITGGTFVAARIPGLDASKITGGTFDAARIPGLNASKITGGTFVAARIPDLDASKITSGTFNVAQIPDLNADKITSGRIDVTRLPAIALTNVVTDTTMANFQAIYTGIEMSEGDVLILTTDKNTYIHNGGTAGTAADFTLLETPTDLVTSVAGRKGVVTLVKGDVGLGNVDNTSDVNKPVSTAQQTALNLKANKVSITASTKTKITYNAEGIVTAGADLAPGDIPNLSADKITSDTFGVARIPMLATSKITGLDTALSQLNSIKQRTIMIVDDVAVIPDPAWDTGDIAFEY